MIHRPAAFFRARRYNEELICGLIRFARFCSPHQPFSRAADMQTNLVKLAYRIIDFRSAVFSADVLIIKSPTR